MLNSRIYVIIDMKVSADNHIMSTQKCTTILEMVLMVNNNHDIITHSQMNIMKENRRRNKK